MRNTTRRLVHWGVALLTTVTGFVALALAAGHGPRHRPHTSHVDYLFNALVGRDYLLLASGAALIMIARGLSRGKRSARLTAIVCLLTMLSTARFEAVDMKLIVLIVVCLCALVGFHNQFNARSDPALKRQGVYLLVVGELLIFVYAALGFYFLDDEFRFSSTLLSSVADAARLILLVPLENAPVTRHGEWFVDSVRGGALIVLIVGLAAVIRAVTSAPGGASDRARVQSILNGYGNTALAHFHLLDDKAWFFSSDAQAFIGYRVVGTTAIALGGPVGPQSSSAQATVEFLEFCESNGWSAGFHQLTESERELVGRYLLTTKIGEEAVLEVQTWTDQSKDYKSLRSALRRCERAGYRVVDLSHPLTNFDLARIKEVSDDWAHDGSHRERTFTLGRFDAEYLRSTQVVAVVDADETIQAFANLLPSYKDTNASFDLMRRRSNSVNGVMDFLFVALIHRFANAGYAGMNLGLAPFANITQDNSLKSRAMRTLYDRMRSMFNYPGLYAFKNKWHPRWEPRYLAYPSEATFAKVAAATVRAGELPGDSKRQRIVDLSRKFPITVAFVSLQLWLMTATAVHPEIQHELLRSIGLNWPSLVHGELWRLFTSPLIQVDAGFVWANLLLLFLVPIAEWRLKAQRFALIYFLGDMISTLIVLVGVRITSGVDDEILHSFDGGTSSGSIAVTAAALTTIPNARVRWACLAAGFVVLLLFALFDTQLFDLQHLLAGVVAIGLALALSHSR